MMKKAEAKVNIRARQDAFGLWVVRIEAGRDIFTLNRTYRTRPTAIRAARRVGNKIWGGLVPGRSWK